MSDPKAKTEETAGQAKHGNTSTVSERKLAANRQNAKRSTGPRTVQGKARSRFNALKHGFLAKQIMFSPDGKLLDEGLHELFESLRTSTDVTMYGRSCLSKASWPTTGATGKAFIPRSNIWLRQMRILAHKAAYPTCSVTQWPTGAQC